MNFELQVALRYLKAKRKQAAISLITVISIVGVTAGVAALVIALAINAGFRTVLQSKLLGAQPHISIQSKDGLIHDYNKLTKQVEQMDGVVAAAPSIYQTVLATGIKRSQGVFLKGILPEAESRMSALSQNIIQGRLKDFDDFSIIVGKELADSLGVAVGDSVKLTSAATVTSPFGQSPRNKSFTLVAIFSSGLYDLDNGWVYIPLSSAQYLLGFGQDDAVTNIDLKIREQDLYNAPAIAKSVLSTLGIANLDSTDWIDLNRSTFQALKLERLVMFLTIGLIVFVAAMNIVAMLTMMVLEKTRDMAILLTMGATTPQIRKIFVWQGVIIGVVGTALGLILGNSVSVIADKYQLIRLTADIYSIPFVPFRVNPLDSAIIAVTAIVISFLATLYPSAAAAKLQPVEALRYE
jgi:lipoprotein-releasing system permease protein